jgi:hypothetical protein
VQRSRSRVDQVPCDPLSIERGVRQLLSNKVSGNLMGGWLLVAEHLRLGTWDLLCGWTGGATEELAPRLALQLVHEAALCTTGIRSNRSFTSRVGFELSNGLPFVASDHAIHDLLRVHTVEDSQRVQVALAKLRRASGDFQGRVLAVDPHRVPSHSKRDMRSHAKKNSEIPRKITQTFWLLDADTYQPVCFTTGTSARTVAQATPQLLDMATEIFGPEETMLILADTEHMTADVLENVAQREFFELLVPMPNLRHLGKQLAAIPAEQFQPRWAGYATTIRPYRMKRGGDHEYYQYVQRNGERPEDWHYRAFLSTCQGDVVQALAEEFPKRWHIEEFFNAHQALGWKRSGTLNLNIRYGQMTMALLAQAALHQFRQRLGEPLASWDSLHFAKDLLLALEGDVRVTGDTILVTYYNAPHAEMLRKHYEDLPAKLRTDHVDPRIPWLYGFQLDFRFR